MIGAGTPAWHFISRPRRGSDSKVYRGLTQQEAAEKADISVPYLSQLESNKRKGSLDVLSALAKALNVALEMIVPAK